MHRIVLAAILSIAFLWIATTATAHFNLNQNVRIFHVVHTDEGLDIYLRTPMAYLVAEHLGASQPDGLPAPAPFTRNRLENGVPMHLVDWDALRTDPLGLGRLAADAMVIDIEGVAYVPKPTLVRVAPIGQEPGFATLSEARTAMQAGSGWPTMSKDTYVGDAVVDIRLSLAIGTSVTAYSLRMANNPGLPGQADTANLILDYSDDNTRTYRATGLLSEPVTIAPSAVVAASTFVIEGIRHILEGLDHVLFVLCMIIGAASLHSLIGRVTGFTLGHTVTLIAGFFGIAPQGAWFIPAVETAIAVSIILVALDAVLRRGRAERQGDPYGLAISGALGLLHGFGFSFMLHHILRVDAPNVWQSLLAFNVGVEIGQLLIVAAIWPLVLFLRARQGGIWQATSGIVAVVSSAIAVMWIIDRAPGIFA